jgi:4-amino-4-deoxy-L-arabinose transferase-like glycosyltransferase
MHHPAPPAPTPRSGAEKAIKVLAWGCVAAVHVAVFLLYWSPRAKVLWGDENTYLAAANSLLSTGSSNLDLLWPPLYPHMIAGLLALGGGSLIVVQLAQLGLLFASAYLLCCTTARLIGSPLAGTIAAFLLLADPTMAAFATYLWPEVLHNFLFLTVLWALVEHGDRTAGAVVAGVGLGLALLTKSLLGPFLPVLLLPLLLPRPRGRALARTALVVGIAALAVTPVILSNGRTRGAYVVADSSRFNIWVGLNDESRKTMVRDIAGREFQAYTESAPDFRGRQEVLGEKIAALVHQRGPARVFRDQVSRQYFRLFDRDSYLDDQFPGGPSHISGAGYPDPSPWLVRAVRVFSRIHYVIGLVAGVFGILACSRRASPWIRVALAFIGYNLVIFLVLHVKSRYRLPFIPVVELFAAGCISTLWSRVTGGEPATFGPWRLTAASLLALLLLFLAFGGSWLPG